MPQDPDDSKTYWKAREMLAHEYRMRGETETADQVLTERAGFAAVCAIVKALKLGK